MSQDIISDTLNEIMNAKRSKKTELVVNKNSRLLRNVLDLAKAEGYLDYSTDGRNVNIKIKNLNEFKAIKPRYTVSVDKIKNYVRRYLPAKNFGFIIISTNKGLIKHNEAEAKNLGGCLIAYIY